MTGRSELFVGRERELRELAAVLRDQRGGVVLVAGEAGVGKTRLVAEAVQAGGRPAVSGSCWQGDGAPAFWPWTQIIRACLKTDAGAAWRAELDPAVAEVLELVLGKGRPTPMVDASRFVLFECVTDLLGAVAPSDGLAIVLDDLQWADDASLRLLSFAVRALHDQPVAVVGIYRDDEVGPDHRLSTLLAELAGLATHLRLTGLDLDALTLLARARSDERDVIEPGLVQELHRLTGGNPFFAREVLALVRGRQPAPPRLAVPAGVRAVITQRLARLSNRCDDVLKVAAVIGSTFTPEDLAAATELSVPEVLVLLDEAIEAQVVTTDDRTPGGLRYAHDLLRETIYDSMAAASRVGAHARVAATLEARGDGSAPPATVAHHLIGAVPLVERSHAVAAAMRAGASALAVVANEEASEWFERALSLVRADTAAETDAIGPLLALGEARLRSSDLARARDAYVEAANIARRHHRPDDLAHAALGLGAGLGGFEIALFDHVQIDLLEEALGALAPADSSRRAQLLARLSVALSFVADEHRRLDLSAEAVAMARRLGDHSALGFALAARCDALAGPAHSEARRDAAAEVVALARGLGDRRLELLGRRLSIVALLELGAVAEVDAQIRAYSTAADSIREPLYRWYVPLWRGMRALMAGRVDDSAALCAEAASLGADAGSVNALMLTLTQEWVRLRVEGRFADAAQFVDEKAVAVFGDLAGTYAIGAWGRFHLGDRDAARSLLRGFTSDLARVPQDAEWLPSIAQLAEVAAGLGDRAGAAVLDAAMKPFDDRVVVEGIGAAVYGTLGAFRAPLAHLLGRDEEARDVASTAAAVAERMGLIAVPRLAPGAQPAVEADPDGAAGVGWAICDGRVWTLTFAGETGRVRDSKGLGDLAALLVRPGTSVHVSELVHRDSEGLVDASMRGDDVLDQRALGEFRRRLAELDVELEEADRHHDVGRSAKISAEREFLLAELAGAAGLGGRSRRLGDDVDRARKTVRARLRDAIARVGAAHPVLGRHLDRAVRTGTFCCYDPEVPVQWTVRVEAHEGPGPAGA